MRILVTGGTGFLGQHLTRALLLAGHAVHTMGRDFSQLPPDMLQEVESVGCDLRDKEAVKRACRGVDVVYHVGALSAAWGKRTDFFAINVEGTRAVVEGCLAHQVKRLVYVSSPSVVFTGSDQYNVTEALPYPRRFVSVYSLTKKLGEDLVNAADTRLETVIMRPKAIFGPGDRTLLPQFIAAARRHRLPQIGTGRNLVDLTYVENVAEALLLALEARAAVGKTYTITNDEHVPLWETIHKVLHAMNISTQLRQIPLSLALTVASMMEARAALTGNEPLLTRYSASILARTQTYDIAAAKRDLAYTPSISVATGIERTVAALQGRDA